MNTPIMQFTWQDVKSALTLGILAAVIAILKFVISSGGVFALDYHAMINAGVLAAFTAIVSILHSGLTNSSGKFLGIVKVK